ncbi:MAG: NUDIX hydrolase [Phycisphaeraceae bacterium]|nr:NUDIX hydrolase [Phycisphaeraceae bacterium]
MQIEQAAAVPIRMSRRGEPRVLLVTTSSGQWGVPKGHVEDGEEHDECAQREAMEEAGVLGSMVLPHVGQFRYVRDAEVHRVRVYTMMVDELLSDWPEKGLRRRAWVTLREAQRLVARPGLRQVLRLMHGARLPAAELRRAV